MNDRLPEKQYSQTSQSRRRFLTLTAAAGAWAGMPTFGRAASPAPHRWQGRVLGADAEITLYHPGSRQEADDLIEACVAEIARLEAIFSLHREDSALTRLNRAGILANPPADLRRLMNESRQYWDATGGAFDPTVQPLWTLMADHFSDTENGGPSAAVRNEALARVGMNHIAVASNGIRFQKPGMAVTLNGIAQGYITDRVTAILKDAGMKSVLLDLGEYRAIGRHPAGRDWRIGVADAKAPWRVVERLSVADRAVATSSGWGTPLTEDGRYTHLIDPRTGESRVRYDSVTVTADTATEADALSTALAVTPLEEARTILARFPRTEALIRLSAGDSMRLPG